jgi:hypothetical protein
VGEVGMQSINSDKMSLLIKLFHEAIVYDLDFSSWKFRVRMIAAAGCMRSSFSDKYCAFYNIDFIHVTSISLKIIPEDMSAVWSIYDWDLASTSVSHCFKFRNCSGPEPDLEIHCKTLY